MDVLPPTEAERREVLGYFLARLGVCKYEPDVVDHLTRITSGFEMNDLNALVRLSV
ncbi:Hypothetical predicted protein, partial [Olea europaea subsp. europaea]